MTLLAQVSLGLIRHTKGLANSFLAVHEKGRKELDKICDVGLFNKTETKSSILASIFRYHVFTSKTLLVIIQLIWLSLSEGQFIRVTLLTTCNLNFLSR